MHHSELILTLTGGLSAALILGYLTHRLGLSPIVGYLIAGFVVGPHTPGFIADRAQAEQLAEIGVVLLLFGVGLHFQPKDLLAVRRVAVPGALWASSMAAASGACLGRLFLWTWPASIMFGIALSVASTVVLTRVLADNGDLHTRTGRISVGWLVVEDLVTVLILVMLPAVFGRSAGGAGDIAWPLFVAVAKLGILIAFTFLVAGRLIPRLLTGVARTHSRELFTLSVLVLALGIAVAADYGFGASMALGSFLAGMVVGRSEFGLRAASEAMPMRDAFAVLFFVSVGMLFDPGQLVQRPVLALSTLAIVLFVKPLAAFAFTTLMGLGTRTALGVAVSLSQIGEFTFLLTAVAKPLGILSEGATEALVTASIVSISLNPLYYKLVKPAENWLHRHPALWRRLNRAGRHALDATAVVEAQGPRAVVVGHGPIGAMVARLLKERAVEPTVVELNLETVRSLKAAGVEAVYGDANQREILERAGVAQAVALILTAPGGPETAEMIRIARTLNPGIRVLARASYVDQTAGMRLAGADRVFSGEGEVALAMCEFMLLQLGFTEEEMDRERERVRSSLFAAGN
ncbi:MAG: cation:proton antiporter [Bryobacteraceae bacterium]|nr:cation:proton antiporter [Bryobacteraceae bacterium]